MYFEEENELQHHGIKGQRWGVRRFQNEDGTRTPAGEKRELFQRKQRELTNYEKARYKYDANGHKVKRTLKNMTNDELKESTERLALEEKYNKQARDFKESKTKSKSVVSTGGKIIGSMLATTGVVLLKNALSDGEKKSSEKLRNEILLSAGTVGIGVLAADKGLRTG